MSTQTQVAFEKMIFRKTNSQTGRHVSVTPQNSTMRHLAYGRVILNSSKPSVSFSDGDRETGLICLSGKATVKAAGKEFELAKFDAIYIPRDSSIEISTNTSVDLAEFSAEVNRKYPLKVVRYADVEKDPGLKFVTGGPGSSRRTWKRAGLWRVSLTPIPGTGRVGHLMSTRRCWKKFMCTLTCRSQHTEFSWFTTTRSIRN